MGRFYTGDIEGKFWFGTQSSDDATHFGVNPEIQYDYYGCGCCATDNIVDNNEDANAALYCTSCYTSLDDHLEQTIDDREDDNKTYHESNEIYYYFQERNVPTLQKEIKKLEKTVGKYMEPFTIVDKTLEYEGVTYEYRVPEGVTPKKGEIERIARLCLGKQILYCIEKYGHCGFHAEL